MSQKTHPSRWIIRHTSTQGHCQTLFLPLGKDKRPIIISTRLFNRVYKEYGGASKTHFTGDFAQALRELRSHHIDLGSLPQINANMATEAYDWLDLYEIEVNKFSLEAKKDVPQAPAPKRIKTEREGLRDQIATAAITGFAMHSGPLIDATIMAERAKAVADAYMEIR